MPQKIGFQVLWFALPLSNQIVIKLYSCTPLLLFGLKVNAMRITFIYVCYVDISGPSVRLCAH